MAGSDREHELELISEREALAVEREAMAMERETVLWSDAVVLSELPHAPTLRDLLSAATVLDALATAAVERGGLGGSDLKCAQRVQTQASAMVELLSAQIAEDEESSN
ncbi:MAG TPA: hypothetical protein VMH86_06155 [Rhizomicrobium sp.]|nr:hypothetical protein [Rhizomicrobium sp.]